MTTAQKYALLLSVFLELINRVFQSEDVRAYWRKRAGLETKIQDDAEK
jgi:hypothetical protein